MDRPTLIVLSVVAAGALLLFLAAVVYGGDSFIRAFAYRGGGA